MHSLIGSHPQAGTTDLDQFGDGEVSLAVGQSSTLVKPVPHLGNLVGTYAKDWAECCTLQNY